MASASERIAHTGPYKKRGNTTPRDNKPPRAAHEKHTNVCTHREQQVDFFFFTSVNSVCVERGAAFVHVYIYLSYTHKI
jgi:hypothetical protein